MNLIEKFEQEQINKLTAGKNIPNFEPGDIIEIKLRIGDDIKDQRFQLFKGLCIGKKNRGLHSSFRVFKISYNEGVERIFPLYNPRIENISIIKKGKVRRAKLYYMRDLKGKAARIKEKMHVTIDKSEKNQEAQQAE